VTAVGDDVTAVTDSSRTDGPSRDRLRAMSFNVRYDTAADGDRSWDDRKEMVASVIRFHRPEIVGLQEPLAHQFEYLRERLPEYEWVGEGRRAEDAVGEHNPVGYRRERFDRLDWDYFWLSETPDVPESVGWDAELPRILTWVELRDGHTGTRFVAVNTHFDHRGERARLESARLLRETVAELADASDASDGDGGDGGDGGDTGAADRGREDAGRGRDVGHGDTGGGVPVVVTGDLNLTEADEPYAVLTGRVVPGEERTKTSGRGEDGPADATDGGPGRPLLDARYAAACPHHGPTTTFDLFEGEPDAKIDYVFVTPDVGVRQHAVIADHWDGRVPSDHRPVVAELSFD
jgi:endonuclease/exonuclease/phosphatase family metal-dependent hydrolase